MPILTGKSAVCLTITNMKGRVPGEYLRMALFIYQMIHAQLGMIATFNQAADVLLDLNDNPTLVCNESGFLTSANARLMELLGIDSREVLRGIHLREILDNYDNLLPGLRPGDSFRVSIRNRAATAGSHKLPDHADAGGWQAYRSLISVPCITGGIPCTFSPVL